VNRPQWINEVDEITVEEARALVMMGIPVYRDFYHTQLGWYDNPNQAGEINFTDGLNTDISNTGYVLFLKRSSDCA
jgi:hypothetical protein